jgi:BNR repeat-like domain
MNRTKNHCSTWLVLSLVCSLACCMAACSRTQLAPRTETRSLQFEPEARSMSAVSGISPIRNPKLGVDPVSSNGVYMLAVLGEGDSSRLALLNSSDGGDSFDKPVWVSEPGGVNSHGENSPALIVTLDVMYAAWNQGGDIRLARSLSWGGSFEKPVRISDKPEKAFSGYVSIGVAPNGDVYAVWIDTRESTPTEDVYAIYMARSTDKGATFGKNIKVADHVCECCRPNVSFGPNNEVLVFFRNIYPGSIRDMAVAVTRDGGNTFSAPVRIAEDNWKLEGCPDSGIALARSGNRIYAAWLTEASPSLDGVRLTWSDDAGKSWAPAVLASQTVLDANYPALSASDDGRVELIFQGRNPQKQAGWSTTSAFLVEIDKDGRLTLPAEVPGTATAVVRPTVAAGANGRVFTAWTATTDGKHTVVLSRARHS